MHVLGTHYGSLYEVGQAQVLVEQQVLSVRQHLVHGGQVRLGVCAAGEGIVRHEYYPQQKAYD